MPAFAHKRTSVLATLALAASGLVLTAPPTSAAVVSLDLCATAGTVAPLPTTAPATTVPIWGFGVPATPGDCTTATASLPGPVLSVPQGDVVTIDVTNALPTGHTLSFEIPGLSFDPGSTAAAPGTTVSVSFTATAPGTYLYESGGDAGRQAAMGLFGVLVVRPPTPNQAYDATTAYDVEAILVLSAIDPSFNAAPDTFDMTRYRATYWLINGSAYPDTAPIGATAGQKVLLRYANGGYDNTTMALLGLHEHVVARDAHLLNNPFDADAETIPAGATQDAVATVPSTAPPSVNGFALSNRQLHVTNGLATPGGMMTFIRP